MHRYAESVFPSIEKDQRSADTQTGIEETNQHSEYRRFACEECSEPFYYPRVVCPFCFSARVHWLECSGSGRIYSYSVVRRGEPYAIAFVELDEGPRLMTNIVDCDFDAIRIGDPVAVVFRDLDGVPTPMFSPKAGA